jgi:transposase
MLTQEEYMDVVALRRQGFTIAEIAEDLGYHPATISGWLKAGGPPPAREMYRSLLLIDDRWAARIGQLLEVNPRLLATSIFVIVSAEGFEGSYPTVSRHVRALRGPRFKRAEKASVPIETGPGEECQFDWSDCRDFGEMFGLGELHCFGAILCWSRFRHWWFAASIDQHHTLEGLARFYEAAGGVPYFSRTDRMGALGSSRGRRFVLHPKVLDFARLHGTAMVACAPRDAKRKGKIERPFRDLKETFLEELVLDPPRSITELNARAQSFLDSRVHCRPHSSTGVPPAQRRPMEVPMMAVLPRVRFDNAYVEVRWVHPVLPLVEWQGCSYSVPPEALGQLVECRAPIGEARLEIRLAGTQIAPHRLALPGVDHIWDPDHRAAAERAALGRQRPARPHLRVLTTTTAAPAGDYEVEAVDLSRYDFDGAGQ